MVDKQHHGDMAIFWKAHDVNSKEDLISLHSSAAPSTGLYMKLVKHGKVQLMLLLNLVLKNKDFMAPAYITNAQFNGLSFEICKGRF